MIKGGPIRHGQEKLEYKFPRLRKILQVLPKRWMVERTLSWWENFRRLTIDHEFLADTAKAMVQLACVQMMSNNYFR